MNSKKKARNAILIAVGLLFLAPALVMATAAPETTGTEEPVKVVYFTGIGAGTETWTYQENPYVDYLEERHNIEFEMITTGWGQRLAKLNAFMASGDLPDYMQLQRRPELLRWGGEGFLLPLDDLVDDTKHLKSGVPQLAWDLSKVDGEIVGIPHQRIDPTPHITYVRKDWVDSLDIDITKVRTLDEWHEMLLRFVRDDPDGNGANDTLGIIERGQNQQIFMMFLDAFGAAKHQFIEGELRPYYILDGFRDYLEFTHQLYSEGILDPEYVVTTNQQYREKQMSGKVGMFYRFWSLQWWLNHGGQRDELIAMKPALRQDGTESKNLSQAPVNMWVGLSKDTEHADKIIEIMDWAHSPEGGTFIQAGLEGMDHDVVNGKVVVRPDRRGKNWAWRFFTLGIQKVKLDDQMEDLLEQTWTKDGLAHLRLSENLGTLDEISLAAPYFAELADYDLESQMMEYRDKVIIGKIDLDATWDSFVADWRAAGGDEWIEMHTKWYLEEYKK